MRKEELRDTLVQHENFSRAVDYEITSRMVDSSSCRCWIPYKKKRPNGTAKTAWRPGFRRRAMADELFAD